MIPFATQSRSGDTPSCSQANIRPVRPKPVATSSRIEQHVVAVAQLAHPAQVALRVHQHPGRALHERLHDHGGDLAVVLRQQRSMRDASPGSAWSVSNSSGR